jgi:hypothetical protein
MSVENHPNVHVVDLMLKINSAIVQCLRGKGDRLNHRQCLQISKELAEKAEELIDGIVRNL